MHEQHPERAPQNRCRDGPADVGRIDFGTHCQTIRDDCSSESANKQSCHHVVEADEERAAWGTKRLIEIYLPKRGA